MARRTPRAWLLLPLLAAACGIVEPDAARSARGKAEGDGALEPASEAVQKLARATNDLALRLYAELAPEGNFVLCPAVIANGWALTHAAATGETALQIRQEALGFELDQDSAELDPLAAGALAPLREALAAQRARWKALGVATSQRVYAAEELAPDFGDGQAPPLFDLADKQYGAAPDFVDFADDETLDAINDWVREQTDQDLGDLLSQIDQQTKAMLVTAAFFDKPWPQAFPDAEDGEFWLDEEKSTTVPMMEKKAPLFQIRVDEEEMRATVVELPFAREVGGPATELVMDLVVPEGRGSLETVEAALTGEIYHRWLERLDAERQDAEPKDVRVRLPRFDIVPGSADSSLALAAPFGKLGLDRPFDQANAEFGGLVPGVEKGQLYLSEIHHRAMVRIDEKGGKGGGGGAAEVVAKGITPQAVADHPFLFVIRDAGSGAILLLGRVVEPKIVPTGEPASEDKDKEEKEPVEPEGEPRLALDGLTATVARGQAKITGKVCNAGTASSDGTRLSLALSRPNETAAEKATTWLAAVDPGVPENCRDWSHTFEVSAPGKHTVAVSIPAYPGEGSEGQHAFSVEAKQLQTAFELRTFEHEADGERVTFTVELCNKNAPSEFSVVVALYLGEDRPECKQDDHVAHWTVLKDFTGCETLEQKTLELEAGEHTVWAVADAMCRLQEHTEGAVEDQNKLERLTFETSAKKTNDDEGEGKKANGDGSNDDKKANGDEGDDDKKANGDDEGDDQEPDDDAAVESSGCQIGAPSGRAPVWLLLLLSLGLSRRRRR